MSNKHKQLFKCQLIIFGITVYKTWWGFSILPRVPKVGMRRALLAVFVDDKTVNISVLWINKEWKR